MNKKLLVLLLFFNFISLFFVPLSIATNIEKNTLKGIIENKDYNNMKKSDDWYFLPVYPNYSPKGIPDFDQRQDGTWRTDFSWAFCGPAALANIIWWFDSKNSDPNGFAGDGIDDYPLVINFNPPGNPNPGPFFDDHNFNNINDIETPWKKYSDSGELIERLASYVNIYWYKFPFFSVGGTDRFQITSGARKWIKDAGLENDYSVSNIFRPSFSLIDEKIRNNDGVILRLGYYLPGFPIIFPLVSLHYVSVAGINSNGYIAVCDPEWDVANPCNDPLLHNDPNIVSYDVYEVDFSSPYPQLSSWWIPSFEKHRRVLVIAAVIISQIN